MATTKQIFKALWGPNKTCQQTRFDTDCQCAIANLIHEQNKATEAPEK